MKKPGLLILAAGMGSRFGGLKQLSPIGPHDETIIEYSVYDAIRAGFGKVVFIIRHSFAEAFKERFDAKFRPFIDIEYVFQEIDYLPEGFICPEGREKPWGTGHAILMAKDAMDRPFAVINADDFYGKDAFDTMAKFLQTETDERTYSMVGYWLKNTLSENGSVSRGVCKTNEDADLIEIRERTNIRRDGEQIFYTENQEQIELDENSIVSMNFWGFHPNLFGYLEELFIGFLKDNGSKLTSEFYIPSVVFALIQQGKVKSTVLSADAKWFGVTYQEDLPGVKEGINRLIASKEYPEQLF